MPTNALRPRRPSTLRRLGRLGLCAALALPFGAAALAGAPGEAQAINPCSNVDITVDNEHPSGDPIKIVYLKYQVNGAGSFYTEGLDDKTPNNGNQVSWSNQDLGDANEGSGLVFRVYFKRQLTSGFIPTYDDTRYQEFERLANGCTDGRSYFFTVDETGILGS
jgi:hypothetical protein